MRCHVNYLYKDLVPVNPINHPELPVEWEFGTFMIGICQGVDAETPGFPWGEAFLSVLSSSASFANRR